MVTWRAYGLDLKDFEIFLSLKKNPLQSNAEIGRNVNLSSEAVRSRIIAMKSKGFLRANREINDPVLGTRTQSESNGIYAPCALGLIRKHVVFKGIPDRARMNILKTFCNEHPYTHYRVPAYSESASLYVQFDIPPTISDLMNSLFDGLRELDLFNSHSVLDETYVTRYSSDFSKWDSKRNVWRLGLREDSNSVPDRSSLEDAWIESLSRLEGFNNQKIVPAIRYDFDELDLRLLRELTINSKPVLSQISTEYANDRKLSDEFKKDSTTFSRRIAKLREHIVKRDQLYYDRRVFDLTYPQLITGTFKSGSSLHKDSLHHFFESGILPFDTTVYSNDTAFLIYTTTPPSIAPEISELIWDHAQSVNVFQLQLDASKTYFFYQENYDNQGWKQDSEYVYSAPLASIKSI